MEAVWHDAAIGGRQPLNRQSLGRKNVDSKLRIEPLADHPEVLPVLKEWFETAWESYYGPVGPGDAQRDLLAYTNRGE